MIALIPASDYPALSISMGGKPNICRLIEQLYRCGCKTLLLFLPDEQSSFQETIEKKYPFVRILCGADEGAVCSRSLPETYPGQGAVAFSPELIVQETELAFFLQQAKELEPGNYRAVAPNAPCMDHPEQEPLPLPHRQAPEIGLYYFDPGTCPPPVPDAMGKWNLAAWVAETQAHGCTWHAYPFSQALRLTEKEQASSAQQLLESPFPLLLLQRSIPQEETADPAIRRQKEQEERQLLAHTARELRERNYPSLLYTEEEFEAQTFFFRLCFHIGCSADTQDILDILAEEGSLVLTPEDLGMETTLPLSKSLPEAIAKSLIDRHPDR